MTFTLKYRSDTAEKHESEMAELSANNRKFVDSVYFEAEVCYDEGGNTIVDCWRPKNIVEQFDTMEDVHDYMGALVEMREDC